MSEPTRLSPEEQEAYVNMLALRHSSHYGCPTWPSGNVSTAGCTCIRALRSHIEADTLRITELEEKLDGVCGCQWGEMGEMATACSFHHSMPHDLLVAGRERDAALKEVERLEAKVQRGYHEWTKRTKRWKEAVQQRNELAEEIIQIGHDEHCKKRKDCTCLVERARSYLKTSEPKTRKSKHDIWCSTAGCECLPCMTNVCDCTTKDLK